MDSGNPRVSHAAEPAGALRAVTPNDSTDLNVGGIGGYPRALYIGVSGNVAVLAVGDSAAVTLSNVPVGILPIRAQKVLETGTTATNIVALY